MLKIILLVQMSCTLTGNDHNKRHFYTPHLDSLFKVRRCYSTKCIFARRAVSKKIWSYVQSRKLGKQSANLTMYQPFFLMVYQTDRLDETVLRRDTALMLHQSHASKPEHTRAYLFV